METYELIEPLIEYYMKNISYSGFIYPLGLPVRL